MTLLTLNCFGVPLVAPRASERMRLIVHHIQSLNPDIVCLQEIFLPWHKRIFSTALQQWRHRYIPRNGIFGTGAGLCIFSKFPMSNATFNEFSDVGRWSSITLADKLVEKGWMEISFDTPRPFRIFHTHLTCNYAGDYHPIHRIARIQRIQLYEMSTAVRKVPRHIPAFIVGDLNVPPESSLLRSFLKATKSTDLTPGTVPSVRGNHYRFPILFSPIISNFKVDYILGRGIPPTATATWRYVFGHGEKLSDHLGILLDIKL
ncbi:MAG: endonuclease/exonuclease/phosphatase family protein [Patescibacteria group bacterium]|nr:endonuclease/exonuclease/phosphatase family protein [Patescibacteria group bacterium]